MRRDSKPRLLFLSQVLPYPPDGGVKIRTYHVLRLLARAFEVVALCFYRSKGGALKQDVSGSKLALERLGTVEAFPIPQEVSRRRLVWDHLRSVGARRPYTVYTYESRELRERLDYWLARRRFNFVHADSLDLSGYFPRVSAAGLPVACVHHDVQSVLLQRRARREGLPKRVYLRHQAKLMEQEERRWGSRVDLNVMVSENDRRSMRRVAPQGVYTVVPNGVDVEHFRPAESPSESGVVFVGGTTWFPNLDALRYFRGDILPLLHDRGMNEPVTWVGRASPNEIAEFESNGNLKLTGYVDDIRPYVHSAACYIVPLRVGGGTRIKILDAWAMGKAVVSTSIGCEGLDARDGENILICDGEEEFADAVLRVLSDVSLRRRLSENGRATVERLYSWEAIGQAMNETYLSLLT